MAIQPVQRIVQLEVNRATSVVSSDIFLQSVVAVRQRIATLLVVTQLKLTTGGVVNLDLAIEIAVQLKPTKLMRIWTQHLI